MFNKLESEFVVIARKLNNKMKSCLLISCFFLFSFHVAGQGTKEFVLIDKSRQSIIVLPQTETEAVRLAVNDLIDDVKKITGNTLKTNVTPAPKAPAIYIETKQDPAAWEQYEIQTRQGNLYITGSDELGTIFGIYHFIEEYLGIDPMYFWNDRECPKKSVLSWARISVKSQKPTFKFRGWFINDEDLLTEWLTSEGRRNIDYPFYQQVTSPYIIQRVCETALRMRMNLIIPASFIDILNQAEASLIKECSRRGLYVSMHHVEPMGVSAFSYFNYWKAKDGTKPLFSYYSNREKVEEVWKVYAEKWAIYPKVIWQIGLRGIADRPMWLADSTIPQSDADRGRLISEAMRFQMDLIRKIDKRPEPPVTTTLWAEGSVLNRAGHLTIPRKVTVVFSDNSPGWRWQEDFFKTDRTPENNYGVYYHHQLWSSGPHLVQIVPPAQTYKVLNMAVQKGDTNYCIMNVSNIREFQLGIAASAQLLWNFKSFHIENFNEKWFKEKYHSNPASCFEVYQKYFSSFELNDNTATPIFMDGQTVSVGNRVLVNLKIQLTDSAKYRFLSTNKSIESEESRWARTALADMGSGNLTYSQQLEKVKRQKAKLLEADSMAKQLMTKLSLTEKTFFQTNLVSHLKIMTGLTVWLENVLLAKFAVDNGSISLAGQHLQQALSAFTLIKEGQDLNVTSEKWKHWYRGEKKMNLIAREKITSEIFELIKSSK